jgi:DNA replication and repair protein RecF
MHVALLRGENFRLYREFAIELDPRLNLIIGANAAGKTSLLEALFVSSRGRSFRNADLRKLAGPEGPVWNVFAELETPAGARRLGIGWNGQGLDSRLDGVDASVAEIVRALPLQLIDPLSHRVIEEGPAYRRGLLDWGVFHVEHSFLDIWRRYGRVLRQRNAALKSSVDLRAAAVWHPELAARGEEIDRFRRRHVEEVQPIFSEVCEALTGELGACLEWSSGWPEGTRLFDVLEQTLETHRDAGTTTQGPHRAELRVRWGHRRARDVVSRGQQKLLVVALVLAQAAVLNAHGVTSPTLLVDDFASELSKNYQQTLAEALRSYPGQCLVTAFEIPEVFATANARVFHVEHGTIRS